VKFFCVGRKGYEQLRRQFESRIVEHMDLRSVPARLRQCRRHRPACRGPLQCRRIRRLHAVLLALQVGDRADPDRAADHPARHRGDRSAGPAAVYDYEPAEDEILADLLPRNLAVQIFRALLENNASFYGAQMSAMDNATRNAGEMIRKQTLTYNRTRQAMITKELIEIISGAEAV
jgi:F-type H+-transporting ATPase subunit gamma